MVGEADFVKQTLDELGQVDFWKIAMKPGNRWPSVSSHGCVFGLRASGIVMATFYQFVQRLAKDDGDAPPPSLTVRIPCAVTLRNKPAAWNINAASCKPMRAAY